MTRILIMAIGIVGIFWSIGFGIDEVTTLFEQDIVKFFVLVASLGILSKTDSF